MGHNAATWAGLGMVGLAALLLALAGPLLPADETAPRLAAALALMALVAFGLGLGWHKRAAGELRQALLWAACLVTAVIAASFHGALLSGIDLARAARPAAEMVAAKPADRVQAGEKRTQPGSVTLRAEANGHFFADALVEGTHVVFLVDTGSTDVALTADDAKRIGIDLARLSYTLPIATANGRSYAALVELEEIVIGTIRVENVTAAIPNSGLGYSLLGMSFLKRLSGFTMDTDRLVLRQ